MCSCWSVTKLHNFWLGANISKKLNTNDINNLTLTKTCRNAEQSFSHRASVRVLPSKLFSSVSLPAVPRSELFRMRKRYNIHLIYLICPPRSYFCRDRWTASWQRVDCGLNQAQSRTWREGTCPRPMLSSKWTRGPGKRLCKRTGSVKKSEIICSRVK